MTLQWDRRINYMYLQTNFDLLQAKVKCDSYYSVLRLCCWPRCCTEKTPQPHHGVHPFHLLLQGKVSVSYLSKEKRFIVNN